MLDWRTKAVELGPRRAEVLGRCVAGGRVLLYVRAGGVEAEFSVGPKEEGEREFRSGKRLAVRYRLWPLERGERGMAAVLEGFAALLLRREEELEGLLAREGGRGLETGPVRLVAAVSEGDALSLRVAFAEGGREATVAVGPRGRFPLGLFLWSARFVAVGSELNAGEEELLQQFFVRVAGELAVGGGLGLTAGEAKETRRAAFVYFDMARPVSGRERLKQAEVRAGDHLVVHVDLPTRCRNRCVFCARTVEVRPGEERPLERVDVPAQLEALLGDLRPLMAVAGRTDVVLAGRDALASDEIVPVLARLRREPRVRHVSATSPGTGLAAAGFAGGLLGLLDGVTMTLLGPDAGVHDLVAGREGAFADLLKSVENLERVKIGWELNTVVVRQNVGSILGTLARAVRLGSGLRVYFYVSEPCVPAEQARECYARYSDLAAELAKDRGLAERGVRALHYVPLCVLPEWARGLSGHSSQRFPDVPTERPGPCRVCPAFGKACGSAGGRYLEIFGDGELKALGS